jgi:predicted glycosyltransferase
MIVPDRERSPILVFFHGHVLAHAIRLIVVARAEALVSITGIGAIYQALRCGKPILGVPEHADQHAHLGRVEALGLGRMLATEQLTPRAIGDLMVDRGRIGPRCRAVAEHLVAWRGGETAADVVDRHLSAPRPARLDRLGGILRRYASFRRATPLRWIPSRYHRRP